MVVKRLGTVFIDQLHTALGQTFAFDKRIIGIGDNIDDGIADGEDVEAGFGHHISCKKFRAP